MGEGGNGERKEDERKQRILRGKERRRGEKEGPVCEDLYDEAEADEDDDGSVVLLLLALGAALDQGW